MQPRSLTTVFSRRRALFAIAAAVAIMCLASWMVRAHPNPGYQAGYEAVTEADEQSIKAGIDAAGGTARPFCDALHGRFEQSTIEPRYDYATFMQGCGDAIDHRLGAHVPMALPVGP